jgi:hypothetical protein
MTANLTVDLATNDVVVIANAPDVVIGIPGPTGPAGSGGGGVTAHSALTGLTADDHPQYARTDGTRGPARPVPILRSGRWSASSRLALVPAGNAWPIINRAYFIDFPIPGPVTVTAIGYSVGPTPAAAGNVIRFGIWADNDGTPGTLIDQATVAADVAGAKTWTLTTPFNATGARFWLAAGPQGTGSPGNAWLSVPSSAGHSPTAESGATYTASTYNPMCMYQSFSGVFTSNPTLSYDSDNGRNPHLMVRFA